MLFLRPNLPILLDLHLALFVTLSNGHRLAALEGAENIRGSDGLVDIKSGHVSARTAQ